MKKLSVEFIICYSNGSWTTQVFDIPDEYEQDEYVEYVQERYLDEEDDIAYVGIYSLSPDKEDEDECLDEDDDLL